MNLEERQQAIEALRERAFDTGVECPHCEGSGRLSGGPLLVHNFVGIFGADTNFDDAAEEILMADEVHWAPNALKHDLAVTTDGKTRCYDAKEPKR